MKYLDSRQSEALAKLVIANGMAVLFIGLVAGVMLIFELLGGIGLWPLPILEIDMPGTSRGWTAAHVGGILNGVMIAGLALLMSYLKMSGKAAFWVGWGLIVTGWANTIFYWAGNVSSNRGLSVAGTPFGPGDLAGAVAFIGGGVGMVFTFIAVFLLGRSAWQAAKDIS